MRTGIIGAGNVGVAVAAALVMRGIGREVVLYNRTLKRAEGEAWDLNDAVPLLGGTMNVEATSSLEDMAECNIIVITVGAKQAPGESRLDLLGKNAAIVEEMMKALDRINPEAVVIVVTNPVDVLTRIALGKSRRDTGRLFGSGTVLDTIRLKEALGKTLDVNRKNVHAYIAGEHGDSEFALWSAASVGPLMLDDFGIGDLAGLKKRLQENVRCRAYDIIEKKGYTSHAIGVAVATLVKAILYDEKKIFTVAVPLPKNCYGLDSDIVLSQPCILGRNGIEKKLIFDCELPENSLFRASAQKLDEVYRSYIGRK